MVRTLLLLLLLALPASGAAQGRFRCAPERRITAIDFQGSPRFGDDSLAAAIVTRPPTWRARWFRIGDFPCADTTEVQRDALRLAVIHRRAGWFTAAVTPRYERVSGGARVVFDIVPGPPALIDTIRIRGLPEAPEGRRPFDAPLRAMQGEILDRSRLSAAVDAVLDRLRNVGYARALRPANTISIDTANARASVDFEFTTGVPVRIGEVHVVVQGISNDPPRADSSDVMRLIGVRAGDRFRGNAVLEAQRDLYRAESFRLVVLDTHPARVPSDSVIDLRITLAEARTRYARTGIGWATQDCMRWQGRLADRSFLGVGRRAELNLRASKLGVGEPADFARALCSGSVRADRFSQKLNYYAGFSVADNRLFGAPLAPVLSVYSERRSEPNAYLRETTIGTLLELTRPFTRRTTAIGGLQYENGRTETDPVTSCERFAQCRPEDYEVSLFGRGVGILSSTLIHDRTNGVVNPTNGQRLRAELRVGQTFSEPVSSLRFFRGTGEGSAYLPFLGGVFATRLQLSRAFAPGAQLVDGAPLLPPQERLFAGGQNSVRGFQQNLLGPIVYVVTEVDTIPRGGGQVIEVDSNATYERAVPRGGTALVVANFEYRRTLRAVSDQLQLALFVDVGNVWETATGGFRREDLRATPGIGFRLGTPLGPFRVDLGYSPYPLRAGRALLLERSTDIIRCASPGNTSFIDREAPGVFECPETFQPPRGRNVLSRLVFHFGLGQAF